MRTGRLAFPILVFATACSPLRDYQEAARSLRFHLDRVEPGLRLSLPVDRSHVAFRLILGVENPSTVAFHVLAFSGELRLEAAGAPRPIGRIELATPLDLPPGGSAKLDAELTFSYGELRDNWVALQSIAKGAPGAWHLEGTLKAETHGFNLQLPVRASRSFGGAG